MMANTPYTIRIPQETLDHIRALAKAKRRSINAQFVVLLEKALTTEAQ